MRKAPLFMLTILLLLGLMCIQVLTPDRTVSDRENRTLTQLPEFSPEAMIWGEYGDQAEKYIADQMPFRDGFVTMNTVVESIQGKPMQNDVLLGSDGFLFDVTSAWNRRNVILNTGMLEKMAVKTQLPVYLCLVPSSAAVYGDLVPDNVPMADEEELLSAAESESLILIPLLSQLKEVAGERQLYYRTDHHWTLDGARIGYAGICRAMGLIPVDMNADRSYDEFYGSFYARVPSPFVRSDVFAFPDPAGIRLTVGDQVMDGLYDAEKAEARDKYAALLYGNHGLLTLENPEGERNVLLVLKDSYANILLPTLARHYRKVIAVDPRYYNENLADLIRESEPEALLCLCGLNSYAGNRQIALLRGF